MSALRYKVGDKVLIKSIDWYNQMLAIKDKYAYRTASNGCEFIGVWCGNRIFKNDMIKFCGQVMTIKAIENEYYVMHEDTSGYWYCDEMIEGLAEEEVGLVDNFSSRWVNEFNLPEGYIFKDENGNEILTSKIILEKKKEYPKTYEECREILKVGKEHTLEGEILRNNDYKIELLVSFQKLLVCRDAYWKLYGEEMGLGKPWEPTMETVYCISRNDNVIKCSYRGGKSNILEFPTPEMRDAFKENFDPDIEICKEFL